MKKGKKENTGERGKNYTHRNSKVTEKREIGICIRSEAGEKN